MMKKRLFSLFTYLLVLSVFSQNALDFDGIDDKIDVGNPPSLQISGNNITVEAWINPSSWAAQVWQGNIVNQENNSTNDGFMLRVGANGTLNFGIGTATTSWYEINSSPGDIQLNTWTHVAGTYDGSYLRIYKNGQILDSMSITGGAVVAGNIALTIGARRTDRFYHGKIDEVRIWTVTRTGSQIAQDMNGEFCGSIPGLEFYLKLNDGVAGGNNIGVNTAPDFSTNANNGTLSGFALTGATSNWVTGQMLTIPPGDSVAISDSLCDGYKYYVGNQAISTPGNHKVHLINQNGCDSLVDLTLYPQNVDATASYVGQSFEANNGNAGATYQWVNCANWGILVGETNQVYWPSDNGEYAVFVTQNNCTDTSDCMSLLYASTQEYSQDGARVYPNPGSDRLMVEIENFEKTADITVMDFAGRVLQVEKADRASYSMDTQGLPAGSYFIIVKTEKKNSLVKWVKVSN